MLNHHAIEALVRLFGFAGPLPNLRPSYIIAPAQEVPSRAHASIGVRL